MNKRRVVITGLGVVSPFGVGVETFWQSIVAGKSGITKITHFDAAAFDSQISGYCHNYDPTEFFSSKEARNLARFVQFASVASKEAVEHAKLNMDEEDADRVWRAEVNRQLEADYATLFAELDALLLLQAPSFDAVFNWRWQQEQQLSRRFQQDHPALMDPTMTRSEVADFVLHYQRLTEHGMATLPDRADCVWELTEDRTVGKMRLAGLAA